MLHSCNHSNKTIFFCYWPFLLLLLHLLSCHHSSLVGETTHCTALLLTTCCLLFSSCFAPVCRHTLLTRWKKDFFGSVNTCKSHQYSQFEGIYSLFGTTHACAFILVIVYFFRSKNTVGLLSPRTHLPVNNIHKKHTIFFIICKEDHPHYSYISIILASVRNPSCMCSVNH